MSRRDIDRFIPWLVLGVFLAITAGATYYVFLSSRVSEQARFENAVQATRDQINFRLDNYASVLRATSGLFASDDLVTTGEFHSFIEHLDLAHHYPGMQTIGFVQRVGPEGKQALTKYRQLQTPDFHIWPPTDGEAYPITMMEPFNEKNHPALGYDMSTVPERREAMDRARDTGAVASTGRVALIQSQLRRQPAFIMFVPVYRPRDTPANRIARRQSLFGFVYSPLRLGDLMQAIFSGGVGPDAGFEIYDSPDLSIDRLVYSSSGAGDDQEHARFKSVQTIDVGGRRWSVRFFYRRTGWGNAPLVAGATLIGGLLASFLTFALIRVQLRARSVAESTAEQLRVSEAELQQASRAKDEFLATLSHELRTPMTAIMGWSKLLAAPDIDDETRTVAIEAVQKSSKAQAQLIDDLLDVSRITAGKMRIELKPVELAPIVTTAIDAVAPAAEARGVMIERHVAAAPILVNGDAQRLQQVIWNLLSNAVKFTPRGGRVTVTLRADAGEAVLEVRDTGSGIEPAFLPYVFERFRQADSSTSRAHAGLGLGLAIVRHLIELHGGDVHAASEGLGHGATFSVNLPLLTVREGVRSRDDAGTARSNSLENAKVLVVDDEADVRDYAATVFRRASATVRTAESAEEALRILNEWRPDVVVSDLGMPGVDGFELLRRIRERFDSLAVVALTAYARPEDRQRVMRSGFDGFVKKPVEPAVLVEAVAEVMRSVAG